MATSPGRRPDPVAVTVTLDRHGSTDLSTQLADALRADALEGRLRRGDRLPSTRELGRRLGVSRTVTAAAYQQLYGEGWLQPSHGAGTYVAAAPAPGRAARGAHDGRRRTEQAQRGRLESRTHSSGIPDLRGALAVGDVVDLRPGLPLSDAIEPAMWRRAWRAAGHSLPLRRRQDAGTAEYRTVVADHLLRHRGLHVPDPLSTDGVLATGGTATALLELARAVLRPGRPVGVESPGWPRAVRCLQACGLEAVPVPVDEYGLVPDLVPPHVQAVYVTPSHQYPLGARLPAERRLRLLDLAARHDWLLIEDDYDGELRYDVAPPPLLAALHRERVVHLGSTSKILTPALDTGWMVAPHAVAAAVLDHRAATSPALSHSGQHAVTEMARNGDLARHMRRLRKTLARRRDHAAAALGAIGVTIPGDNAGAHLVIPLTSHAQEQAVVRALVTAGLITDALSSYSGPGSPQERPCGLVLGITTGTETEYHHHLAKLTRTVHDLVTQPARPTARTNTARTSDSNAHLPS